MLATQAPWIIICFQYRDLYFYMDASILKHTAANTINRRDNITVKRKCAMISNGNRTEWSPIRSVIIRVINKIGRPRSGSPICLITSMITDRIGQHEVLLPVNHNFNKICDI